MQLQRTTILDEDIEIGFTSVSLGDVVTEIQRLRLEKLPPAAEKLIDTLQLLTAEMTLLREEVQKLKREVKYKPPIGGRGYHEQMEHLKKIAKTVFFHFVGEKHYWFYLNVCQI